MNSISIACRWYFTWNTTPFLMNRSGLNVWGSPQWSLFLWRLYRFIWTRPPRGIVQLPTYFLQIRINRIMIYKSRAYISPERPHDTASGEQLVRQRQASQPQAAWPLSRRGRVCPRGWLRPCVQWPSPAPPGLGGECLGSSGRRRRQSPGFYSWSRCPPWRNQ